MAKADLILSMSNTELKQVKNCDTSNEIWRKLHDTYQSKGPARKGSLLKSLILCKLSNGGDMRNHIVKLSEVELVNIKDLLAILLLYSIDITHVLKERPI